MRFAKTQHVFIFTLTLCMLLFLTPRLTSAQTVNIPDTNLRAAIAETLGKAPNAGITADEMATLREFRAVSANIKNLKGLETAVNLDGLTLHTNAISDLSPLAGLTKLRHIGLDENVITDLSPLEKLVGLVELILGHNLISDLSPLEGLINLRGIGLHHNAISDLSPLAGLIRLEWIGYQLAGIYQYRSRAAYWDGKNEVGELVASGVYFYTLTTGDFTATRKMLITK